MMMMLIIIIIIIIHAFVFVRKIIEGQIIKNGNLLIRGAVEKRREKRFVF